MITSFTGEYGFLSNFYPHVQPVPWYGAEVGPLARRPLRYWPTNEHYFQAAKALVPAESAAILAAPTPAAAKRLGRQVPLRADWEAVRLDVMLTGLRAKFLDNELAERLLDTGTLELVEVNTWGDNFWGMCGWDRKEGQNWLGKLLMLVREETRGRMR